MEVSAVPGSPSPIVYEADARRRPPSCSPTTVPHVPGGSGSRSTWPGWRWSKSLFILSSKNCESAQPNGLMMFSNGGEQHSEQYKAINPMCQVPTLKINGDSLSLSLTHHHSLYNIPARSDSDPVSGHHGVPERPPPRGRPAAQLP